MNAEREQGGAMGGLWLRMGFLATLAQAGRTPAIDALSFLDVARRLRCNFGLRGWTSGRAVGFEGHGAFVLACLSGLAGLLVEMFLDTEGSGSFRADQAFRAAIGQDA